MKLILQPKSKHFHTLEVVAEGNEVFVITTLFLMFAFSMSLLRAISPLV